MDCQQRAAKLRCHGLWAKRDIYHFTLLCNGASFFSVSSKETPHAVAFYDMQGDAEDLFVPGTSQDMYMCFTPHHLCSLTTSSVTMVLIFLFSLLLEWKMHFIKIAISRNLSCESPWEILSIFHISGTVGVGKCWRIKTFQVVWLIFTIITYLVYLILVDKRIQHQNLNSISSLRIAAKEKEKKKRTFIFQSMNKLHAYASIL
jgi:hypothetical protein